MVNIFNVLLLEEILVVYMGDPIAYWLREIFSQGTHLSEPLRGNRWTTASKFNKGNIGPVGSSDYEIYYKIYKTS